MTILRITNIVCCLLFFAVVGVYVLYKHAESQQVWHAEEYDIIDGQVVYWSCIKGGCHYSVVEGADPVTFLMALSSDYGKDKNYAYYRNSIVSNNPESFVLLDRFYAKIQNNIYFKAGLITDADPETFVVLDYFHAKDKNHVYYKSKVISGADPGSIELLHDVYSRDKNNVYYEDKIVPKPSLELENGQFQEITN